MRILAAHGPLSKRELQRKTNAHRDGTELWSRALEGLIKEGMVGKAADGRYCAAG